MSTALGESRWIRFDGPHSAAGRLTSVWHVMEKAGKGYLGTVVWFTPWRKYAFSVGAVSEAVFEEECLRDIAMFCENATAAQRADAKARRQAKAFGNKSARIAGALPGT